MKGFGSICSFKVHGNQAPHPCTQTDQGQRFESALHINFFHKNKKFAYETSAQLPWCAFGLENRVDEAAFVLQFVRVAQTKNKVDSVPIFGLTLEGCGFAGDTLRCKARQGLRALPWALRLAPHPEKPASRPAPVVQRSLQTTGHKQTI